MYTTEEDFLYISFIVLPVNNDLSKDIMWQKWFITI